MKVIEESARPFQIKVINHGEVRMGSPYNLCEIELVGFNKITLPRNEWQDKFAWSENNEKLVLVKWNFEDNIPGFHFFIIDTKTGTTMESERIFGLLNSMAIEENKIKFNKFLLDREKSKRGELCCFSDHEYSLSLGQV